MLILVVVAEGKTIEHGKIMKHLFILVNKLLWVEIWAQSLLQTPSEWVVLEAIHAIFFVQLLGHHDFGFNFFIVSQLLTKERVKSFPGCLLFFLGH